MAKTSRIPNPVFAPAPLVTGDPLSVAYWRDQLPSRISHFDSVAKAAEALGKLDPAFAGTKGYFQLTSAVRGRAGLQVTARAVQLIDTLFPPQSPPAVSPDRLSRQGLVRKRN